MRRIPGYNPVLEALRSGTKIKELLISKRRKRGLKELLRLASQQGVKVRQIDHLKLKERSGVSSPQGVLALAEELKYLSLEDLLLMLEEDPLVVILDHLQDPYNLGAIIRSSYLLGADGVVIPRDRSAGLSPTVSMAAAGAVEYLPLVQVTNIARSLKLLKEKGLWVAGAEAEGGENCDQRQLTGPLALVIGSEGKGLRPLVKKTCDYLIKIPLQGQLDSLNASVAAGILLYEIGRQRRKK